MSKQLILVTAGYDKQIKFWDVASGLPTHSIEDRSANHINKMVISSDRRYLGVAGYNVVKVYQLNENGIPDTAPGSEVNYEGHTANITSIQFQKDNKWFFTSSEDGTLKIFDFKMAGFMRNFDNEGVSVNAAVLHPNQGEIIFGDQNGRVRIWDLAEGTVKDIYTDAEETPIRSIAISKDATKLVAGNSLGFCFIWESRNGEGYVPMQELLAHKDSYVLKCQFSADNQFLATCSSDKTCIVWQLCEVASEEAKTDEEVFEEYVEYSIQSGHGGWVWDCDFTVDNNFLITVSTDTKARIWRMGKEEIRQQLIGHTKGIITLAFCDALK